MTSQMSLLSAVLPADYPYVVAVGTVGVYSVLQYASINVSKARKAAGVKCESLDLLSTPPLLDTPLTCVTPCDRPGSLRRECCRRARRQGSHLQSVSPLAPLSASSRLTGSLSPSDCAQRAHNNTLEVSCTVPDSLLRTAC